MTIVVGPEDSGELNSQAAPLESTEVGEVSSSKMKENKITVFEPGDHVTRWEMLPIAWPILVHGIVLNVHDDNIVLVDFGLSAPQGDPKEGKNKPSKKVEQAIRNFKISPAQEKNRLNITVLTDPKDIAKWKKVNYDGNGLFGSNPGNELNGEAESAGEESPRTPTKAQRTKDWFKTMGTSFKEKTKPIAKSVKGTADSLRVQATAMKDRIRTDQKSSVEQGSEGNGEFEAKGDDIAIKASGSSISEGTTSLLSEGESIDFSSRSMNPKMKELLQKKQELNPSKTMNPAMAKVLKKKKEEEEKEDKRKASLAKLPKSDPPKLVLARTHWLLEHGESVLPPYHAFSSNSECIAVFCKTGCFRTLQADIFLASTAIGNAKTMTVTTIGVAAAAPLLAPVVGVAGLAMVGAPLLYNNKQRKSAVDSQQRLTDAFWAQAEPEVFVECIQHWSKELLGLEGGDKEEEESNDEPPVVQQI